MVRKKMMAKTFYSIFVLTLLMAFPTTAEDQNLQEPKQQGNLKKNIRSRSESALLYESIALEQARAKAQSRSEYSQELRPRVSDNDVGVALRIYLPACWKKSKLREQLSLVAKSEQLRVAALDWEKLMQVYRQFCEYRMYQKQQVLFNQELLHLKPYLEKADLGVTLNQLSVTDRAKLYSLYLDLINNHEKVKFELLDLEQALFFILGANADLDRMSEAVIVGRPSRMEFDALMRLALKNRADYKQFDVHTRSLDAAEHIARSEDGFHLKYIQPDYKVDYKNGGSSYGLSASFVLPWGTRNPDITIYQQQRALELSEKHLQRTIIAERLQILLKTSEVYYQQAKERSDKLEPLLKQLSRDLKMMNTGRLEELRDLMLIRERMLNVSLQATKAICKKEKIAIDLAEETGTLVQ
jgi:hypothetical protein